ncbi:D-alanyl-D-alanine carboxypeptidase [Coxiella-like endosymbiont]|uniref:D-alanyl-D-alanine carboxypeptidase family protein n=2 Tax=Coxiellaceae TaxID=118968 RepID=UPI000C809EB8|nr:D-alanyl-D-alanine carboxypeptidase family protein [Coxiella endosymbiont of Rhipicephalus microplus]PMB54570.1 D-alanyl-D-alanine carboxypeptidase [Coxiella-like endosymbiont]
MKFLFSRTRVVFFHVISLSLSFGIITAWAGNPNNTAQQNLTLKKVTTNQEVPKTPPFLVPPPPNLNVKGYVLMDANSGAIIAEKNMNQRLQPASLTKLMTLYLAFQALKSGQIHLNDKATVSITAWRTGGSRMFLKEGSSVPIDSLIQGIIVASGNDACVTVAQYIAGTEESFTEMMNQTAQRLGMKSSHYVDSPGLPNPNHYSTAYDMAVLTRAIIKDFPEYYHFFSQKWLTYNNIKQPNRNRLLWHDNSVDGLKTGHTKAAGYCLIASTQRKGMRLISVVLGATSDSDRADDSEALLNYGFRFYHTQRLFEVYTPITQKRIWFSKEKYACFGLANPLYVTFPIGDKKNLKASIQFLEPRLEAPLNRGQSYGVINISLNRKLIATAPLIALQKYSTASLLSQIWDHITLFFEGILNKES